MRIKDTNKSNQNEQNKPRLPKQRKLNPCKRNLDL